MKHTHTLAAFVTGALIGSVAVATTGNDVTNRAEVEGIVKEFILANPQVIMDSVQKWQAEQQKEKVAGATDALKDPEVKKALYENPHSPVIGNKDTKIAIVEFFDYNCPACKMAFKGLDELIAKDKNVKVIFKEFPIFGPVSDTNSKIGLAVNKLAPGKYFDFHKKMMSYEGRADEAVALKFAAEAGIKEADIKAEIAKPEYDTIITQYRELGGKLGIQGTPSMVIGEELVPYALDYDGLEEKLKPLR